MKTLSLILSMFLGGIVAFSLMGCASDWKCPNAPKLVATFSVGDKVAFTRTITVDTSAAQFTVEAGDTGIVNEIEYLDYEKDLIIRYGVALDKGIGKGWEAHAFQSKTGNTVWDGWIEAVVYPDPALSPRK